MSIRVNVAILMPRQEIMEPYENKDVLYITSISYLKKICKKNLPVLYFICTFPEFLWMNAVPSHQVLKGLPFQACDSCRQRDIAPVFIQ